MIVNPSVSSHSSEQGISCRGKTDNCVSSSCKVLRSTTANINGSSTDTALNKQTASALVLTITELPSIFPAIELEGFADQEKLLPNNIVIDKVDSIIGVEAAASSLSSSEESLSCSKSIKVASNKALGCVSLAQKEQPIHDCTAPSPSILGNICVPFL